MSVVHKVMNEQQDAAADTKRGFGIDLVLTVIKQHTAGDWTRLGP